MSSTNKFSVQKRVASFSYAINGIIQFFKTQHNAWIHSVAAAVAVAAGFTLKINTIEWCAILFCIAFVFVAEMFNTAIEWLTDKVSPEQNPLAGKVKDVAAGAVLIAAIFSVIVGLIIFLPKITEGF